MGSITNGYLLYQLKNIKMKVVTDFGNINITSPDEMKVNVLPYIKLFEERLLKSEPGRDEYSLVVPGEIPFSVRGSIISAYETAGWKKAEITTSSENGERPGLTRLRLKR